MSNTGAIVLTGTSTGTTMKNNLVTTIFSFDCFGRINITYGGSAYNWATNGASSTLSKASSASANMKALPVTIPSTPDFRKTRKRENSEMVHGLRKRYDNGVCPASPAGLLSETKQGFVMDTGNFCDNLNQDWSLSPFDFTGSCEIQSLCYDQCEDFSWEGCNAIFGTSMILSCASKFDSWWEVAGE